MIAHGCATTEERDIITAMSANEGAFESVQSYDRMALTLGAMQKTVNTEGGGELTKQFDAFREKDPAAYKRLFADHGWTVESGKTYYQDAAGTKRTGSALKTWLRSTTHENQVKALGPLRTAGRDPAFRKQQICDFLSRLDQATGKRKSLVGGEKYSNGDFITSPKGKAMLLDTSVNAGPNDPSFQAAVNWFYAQHPNANRNPSTWTAKEREENEAAILDRFEATRPVSDRDDRNETLSNLSSAPNPTGLASQRPARECADCT
jgi:hypothetical protein